MPESIELSQESQVSMIKTAKVRDLMLDHEWPLDTEAESEALPFVGINPAIFQDVRVHHSAAAHFQPATFAAVLLVALPHHVHLHARLDEWEKARPEAEFDVSSDHLAHCGHKDRLKIRQGNVFPNHHAFELMEHRRVRGVRIFAVGFPVIDDPEGRLMC